MKPEASTSSTHRGQPGDSRPAEEPRIRVLFFAQLREVTGCDVLELACPDPLTIEGLWAALLENCPELGAHRPHVRLARNWDYVAEETRFGPGDEVALIPPVSGG